MEHHDLQKCTQQNQGGPGCKEENQAPQWLLTTIWHKKQNRPAKFPSIAAYLMIVDWAVMK